MPTIIIPRSFWRIDVELQEEKIEGKLSDDLQDTLSRLFGWYDAGQFWKKVNVDSQGRLLTSANAGQINAGNISTTVVGLVALKVLSANLLRRTFLIKNDGVTNLFFGFDAAVTAVSGFPLYPGEMYSDDVYVGDIYLISSAANGSVKAIEY